MTQRDCFTGVEATLTCGGGKEPAEYCRRDARENPNPRDRILAFVWNSHCHHCPLRTRFYFFEKCPRSVSENNIRKCCSFMVRHLASLVRDILCYHFYSTFLFRNFARIFPSSKNNKLDNIFSLFSRLFFSVLHILATVKTAVKNEKNEHLSLLRREIGGLHFCNNNFWPSLVVAISLRFSTVLHIER